MRPHVRETIQDHLLDGYLMYARCNVMNSPPADTNFILHSFLTAFPWWMDLIRAHLSQKSISLAATVAGLLKKWIISLSFSLGEQWAISSFPVPDWVIHPGQGFPARWPPGARRSARRNKCPHQSRELSGASGQANTEILLLTNHWHSYSLALFITHTHNTSGVHAGPIL